MSVTLPLPEGIPSSSAGLPRATGLPCVYTSEVIPGLHYNIFQRALIYGSTIRKVQPVQFSILLYLDWSGGSAPLDDLLGQCYFRDVNSSSVRTCLASTSRMLCEIGVPASVHIRRGVAFIDYFGQEF